MAPLSAMLTRADGILVVFWGAALVLILVTAIPMPSEERRKFWVEVSSVRRALCPSLIIDSKS